MKHRLWRFVGLLVTALAVWADGARAQTATLTQLTPPSIPAGSSGFTLKVFGTNIPPDALVVWTRREAPPRPTVLLGSTRISSTEIDAPVAAALVAAQGSIDISLNTATNPVSLPFTVTFAQGVMVTTTSLPNGVVGAPYSTQLSAGGGAPPYSSWMIATGALPVGVTLSPAGVISGTPQSASGSPFSFSVTVRDNIGNTSPAQSLSLTIFPRVNIITTTLPNATAGTAYAATLTAVDGIPPYSNWQVVSGSLPGGLMLNPSAGVISGTSAPASGGPFSFEVTVRDSAGVTSAPRSLTIALGGATPITATPASLAFTYSQGDAAPPPQSISLTSGNTPADFSVTVRSDRNWLSAAPATGRTPATVAVTANIAGLPVGNYTGELAVARAGAAAPDATVRVTLAIGPPVVPQFDISPTQFGVTTFTGAPPKQLQLAVFNTGGGTLNYNVQARTISGNNWITIDNPRGAATPASPGSVGITLNTAALAPGTYEAEVTVTDLGSNQSKTARVVVSVNPSSLSLQLSQSGLQFTASTNGSAGPPQTFTISNAGQGDIAWSLTTQTLPADEGWLTATPAAGASAGAVTVSVNPAGLAAGLHYGTVRITSPGAANSPQVITVLLNVIDAAEGAGPVLSDGGVLLVGEPGAPTAMPPPIAVANLSGQPLSYVSTRSTNDGGDWVTLSPASGTLAADRLTNVTVVPNFSALTPGVRRGTLRLQFGDGSVRTISVASVVPAPGPAAVTGSKHVRPDAVNCSPRALVPHFISPEANFSVLGAAPVSVRVAVVDDCGSPLVAGGVFFGVSNESNRISLTHSGNGVWTATWIPGNNNATVSIVATAFSASPTNPLGGQTPLIPGTIRTAQAPGARTSAIFNSASLKQDQVNVGNWASLVGEGMAEAELLAPAAPFGPQLLTTEVRLGDLPMPLNYVAPNQANLLIPRGLAPNTQHQIVVQRGMTLSVPFQVTVTDVQPAIYTLNAQGSGQGWIMIANTSTIAGPLGSVDGGRPARRNESLSIICAGLGAVDGDLEDGAPAPPDRPINTLATPLVTLGGISAPVSFAGLAPGLVGAYQVDVAIPAAAPSGDAVPVVITLNEIASNVATVAIE